MADKMNWKMASLAVVAIAALIIAAWALAVAYIAISQNHTNIQDPATANPSPSIPASSPSDSPIPASSPAAAQTGYANIKLTGDALTHSNYTTVANEKTIDGGQLAQNTISPVTTSTTVSYNNIQVTSVGSYYPQYDSTKVSNATLCQFEVTTANPTQYTASPNPCNIQFSLTEQSSSIATPTDAWLQVYTEGKDPILGVPDAAYSYFTPITGTASGNTLTFQFASAGAYYTPGITGLSSNGLTVTAGFNETYVMQIAFAVTGTFNLNVQIVPST